MSIALSRRITGISESPIRKLAPLADEAKARGVHVYHLNIGQPDIKTPPNVIEAIQSIDLDIIAYGPSEGLHAYRNLLPSYYRRHGLEIIPEDILVTTAGSEAVFFTLLSLCDAGDEIIIPEPFYTNFATFAAIAGITVVPVTSTIDDDFRLPDIAAFEEVITDRTKAVLFNSPCNPTGTVYTPGMIEALVSLAERHDLYLISDEVYREFIYDGNTYTSILNYPQISDRAVVLDSVSKRYSMCGARVGAIITRNRAISSQILKLAQARLCPPAIEQIAAMAAIETPEEYNRDVLQEYMLRRDTLVKLLEAIPGVRCSHPGGAFYLIAQLPVDDAERFCRYLLEEVSVNGETVMLTPAAGFYRSPGMGADEVRIAYVLNTEDLTASAEILREALSGYPGRR